MPWRRRAALVSEETQGWVTDRFDWLVRTLGPSRFFDDIQLILPTRAFLTPITDAGERTAVTAFDEVRRHMGMADRPVRLVARGMVGAAHEEDMLARTSVAGSFYKPGGEIEAVITYNPLLMRTPNAFIGTLAHELAHYMLEPHIREMPGGEAEVEAMTDLAVVFSGLGMIDLAGARQLGWSGSLNLDARTYALATFLRLKGIDSSVATPFLDTHLRGRLARALAQRETHGDDLKLLEALRRP